MTGRGDYLRLHLSAAVPLRMLDLVDIDPAELVDLMGRLWPHDDDGLRDPWVRDADVILYGPPGPVLRRVLAQLVDGLAVAALVSDGGVTFDGLHWCRDHSRCLEVAA